MPVTFDWRNNHILRVKYYGIISGDDAVDASIRMSSNPRFDNLKGIIIDTQNITKNIATTEHIEQLASISRIMSKNNPRIKNAIILNSDETTNSLAAFYTFLGEEIVWDIKMFHTFEDATQWIFAS